MHQYGMNVVQRENTSAESSARDCESDDMSMGGGSGRVGERIADSQVM